jgi:uncharacterized protein (TIGR02453 family)
MRPHFTPEFFKFLRQLKRHNNREWFLAHKQQYERDVRDPFLRFIEDFRPRLLKISPHFIADPRRSGGSLLRIYRDMRFVPTATLIRRWPPPAFPMQPGNKRPVGFYLHLEPGASFLGGGLWHPDPETRNSVRAAIVKDPAQWRKILTNKRFRSFCELSGESAQRMPPGIDPKHPLAEDLKRKDFITVTYYTEAQICSAGFLEQLTQSVEAAAPFIRFLTAALSLPWSSADRATAREVLEIESPGDATRDLRIWSLQALRHSVGSGLMLKLNSGIKIGG